ncbi:hypothetical protein C3B44_07375 [Corynebacterium yudongzhengii]|uniref:NAD-dependent epimerase/dehydratase domain-containing protein n=1 Tax=Corynebacterium yudongzhengii TaxID=2080740 RepID=A0A2U1T6M1_9CORY|nr:NAD-dependent epimerase/dehydratase family protein [Corynebacterium yudongzhengii]AWB82195.1 hypothetical protein C3B44_07375 [Corynebacterium yudongzhengii]PWC01646.1 hypothetical protein DF222_05900 [Corynebacterium yudongzhengii]
MTPRPRALDELSCEIVTMDVTDTDAVAAGFDGADESTTVIHCAGIVSIGSTVTEAVRTTNVDGTRNILDACREHQVHRLVHVSSVHVIPEEEGVLTEVETFDPELVVGEYAKTKTEATALVKDAASDIDAVIVHPSGIVGPGD